MPKITVKIDAEGKPIVEVDGVAGSSCHDLSAPFTSALGEVESDELKPEYEDFEMESESDFGELQH